MSKDVMIAIMMSLINYVIVTTISSKSAQATQNVLKFLLGENKEVIIAEIKEQNEMTREVLKKGET